jgi:UDP-N-acetylmuramate--alanine ligase
MDCYRNMRDVKKTFLEFMDRVPFYGMIVACNDDPLLRKLLPEVQRRTVTYGTKRGSDFLIKLEETKRESIGDARPLSVFRVSFKKKDLGEFALHVPGVHNVLNATAAIAVGVGLDVTVDAIRSALDQFRGVDRRFQLKGRVAGVSVIDDYGHHPTEIRATLAAARQCGFRKIHVIFQPHRLHAHPRSDGRVHQRLF